MFTGSDLATLDLEITRAINHAAAGSFAPLAVAAAEWLVYLLAVLVLVPFVFEKSWRSALRISATVAGGAGLALMLRWLIGEFLFRPRPFVVSSAIEPLVAKSADSPAFPSGHAVAAFGIAWGLFLWDRRVGAFALVLAAAVAVGRVAVGVHYPSDVIGGALVGILSSWIVFKTARSTLHAPR